MSKFLDELLTELDKPVNDIDDTVATEAEDETFNEVDETTEIDEDASEEIEVAEEEPEASEPTEANDDDETELSDIERKAWGRLKALQDERDKRRSAEEARKATEVERDQLKQQLADMQRQQAQLPPQQLPDPIDDPHGYATALQTQYQEQLLKQSLGFSLERAMEKHGEDEVQKAAEWFERSMAANPAIDLRGNMLAQPDPIGYVVASYKQATAPAATPTVDYSAIVAELQKAGYSIAKADTQPAAATTAPVREAPTAPKRSKVAAATSATTAPPADVSMMDAILRRK